MSLHLVGWGTAVPPYSISQDEAAAAANAAFPYPDALKRLLPALYRRAGVQRRHSVLLERDDGPPLARQRLFGTARDASDRGPATAARMALYEEHSAQLALAASQAALASAGLTPAEITHLVTVSCSGFCAPGFDIALLRDLPLPGGVARTHVGFMGCHGALNGLRVADAFASAQPSARVLVCAVELCSLHHQYREEPEQIVANALFADGAAAVVATGQPTAGAWQVAAQGSLWIPDTADAMAWRIGDHGFEMELSPRIPELIERQLGPWLRSWLDRQGLGLKDIQAWAVHPGGPRILQAVEESLGLSPDALQTSRQVLAELGNMSSPTVLFILDRLRRQGAPAPCVALGFGPGLVFESLLLDTTTERSPLQ